MPMPRNNLEFAAATKACRHCTATCYCSYHCAVNGHLMVIEGQRQIRAMLAQQRPAERPDWARHFEPIPNLTLEEKLVASIAIAKYRKKSAA